MQCLLAGQADGTPVCGAQVQAVNPPSGTTSYGASVPVSHTTAFLLSQAPMVEGCSAPDGDAHPGQPGCRGLPSGRHQRVGEEWARSARVSVMSGVVARLAVLNNT